MYVYMYICIYIHPADIARRMAKARKKMAEAIATGRALKSGDTFHAGLSGVTFHQDSAGTLPCGVHLRRCTCL
jgi:hypothetical protein